MQIDISTLVRTNVSFPAEFSAKTTTGDMVKISYRHGHINIFLNDILHTTTSQDAFDVGGSITDSQLIKVLRRECLVDEKIKE